MSTEMYSRRTVLRAGTGAVVGAAALTNARHVRAQPTFDGWMEGVENYDGVIDETGKSDVTVEVGTEANGGNFGFGPAAVQVDPGTTVTWEWVAGSHNVVDDAGNFESELTNEEGFTFTQTFDEEGVVKYFCMPHKSMGMRGVVVVGDADVGGGGGASSGDAGGESSGGDSPGDPSGGGQSDDGSSGGLDDLSTADWGAIAFAVSLVAGLLSPLAFAAFLDEDRAR